MILILVPHRVVEVELAVAVGDFVPEVIAEAGSGRSSALPAKCQVRKSRERKREDTQFVSGAVDTHCVYFIHLSFRFLSASSDRIIYALVLPNEGQNSLYRPDL